MPGSSQSLWGPQRFPPWKLTPLSHIYCTRTALLPNGHCSTRTTKDKIRAGAGVPPCSTPATCQDLGGRDAACRRPAPVPQATVPVPAGAGPTTQQPRLGEQWEHGSWLSVGGMGRAFVTEGPPSCPELAPEPGADFILGCQRNQNGEKQRKELHRPQPNIPTKGPKQRAATKPKQRSKGRRKVAHSLVGLCFVRAPVAGMEVQASKRGRGFRCS